MRMINEDDLKVLRASARRVNEIALEVKNKEQRRDLVSEAAAILKLCSETEQNEPEDE